jgi:hypothetical protein
MTPKDRVLLFEDVENAGGVIPSDAPPGPGRPSWRSACASVA